MDFELPPENICREAVRLAGQGNYERSLSLLGWFYSVSPPRVRFDGNKIRLGANGCYVPNEETIFLKSGALRTLFHEFYHHLEWKLGHQDLWNEAAAGEFARRLLEKAETKETAKEKEDVELDEEGIRTHNSDPAGWRSILKILIIVIIIALPILSGEARIEPILAGDLSVKAISDFISGFLSYYIKLFKSILEEIAKAL